MAEQTPQLPARITKKIEALQLKMGQVTRTDSILNANQVQKLFNTTKSNYVYERPGKGGGKWRFVRASYLRTQANSIFGYNWDFEVETSVGEAFEVAAKTGSCVVKGWFTGRVKVDGEWIAIKKTQFGRAEVKFTTDKDGTKKPLDFGNDMKAAATDCFKKCLSAGLGMAADIYDPQEFIEIEIVEADKNSDKEENVKKMVEEAKGVIAKQSTKVGEPNE